MKQLEGQCIGIVINHRYGTPGYGAHLIPKQFEQYHNVFAGPFCPYHAAYFQVQSIQEFDDHFPDLAGSYEDTRLNQIDAIRHMESKDTGKVLLHYDFAQTK